MPGGARVLPPHAVSRNEGGASKCEGRRNTALASEERLFPAARSEGRPTRYPPRAKETVWGPSTMAAPNWAAQRPAALEAVDRICTSTTGGSVIVSGLPQIQLNDVLLCASNYAKRHPGTVRARNLASKASKEYREIENRNSDGKSMCVYGLIWQILKEGGRFVISTPTGSWAFATLAQAKHAMVRKLQRPTREGKGDEPISSFSQLEGMPIQGALPDDFGRAGEYLC